MSSKTSSYRESLLIALADPVEASAYLNAALEDSPESFLKALRNVAQANQVSKVARDAGLQRETLYRSLSAQGNPTLGTIGSILRAVGLKIAIDIEGSHQAHTLPRIDESEGLSRTFSNSPPFGHLPGNATNDFIPLGADEFVPLAGQDFTPSQENSWIKDGGWRYAACGNC